MARANRSKVPRTFAGIEDKPYPIAGGMTISNRLLVYKTGSGDNVEEHAEECRDFTFQTIHAIDDFIGSEYESALAFTPASN